VDSSICFLLRPRLRLPQSFRLIWAGSQMPRLLVSGATRNSIFGSAAKQKNESLHTKYRLVYFVGASCGASRVASGYA
jgi:hypothetical protein